MTDNQKHDIGAKQSPERKLCIRAL